MGEGNAATVAAWGKRTAETDARDRLTLQAPNTPRGYEQPAPPSRGERAAFSQPQLSAGRFSTL